jgi:hypothetical protein
MGRGGEGGRKEKFFEITTASLCILMEEKASKTLTSYAVKLIMSRFGDSGLRKKILTAASISPFLLSRKNPGVELSGELLEGAKLQEGD